MKIGLTVVPVASGASPADLGRVTEELGYEALFVPEHSHVAVDQTTPAPGRRDHRGSFEEMLDPIVTLTAAAMATERILLGLGTVVLTYRDPILLAKAVASLDLVARGRVMLGVGAGWVVEELANHGVDMVDRFPIFDEKVRAVRTLLREQPASFHGEHLRFDGVVQRVTERPHGRIPLMLGCQGPSALDRLFRLEADAWLVSGEVAASLSDFIPRIAESRRRSQDLGRVPPEIIIQRADPTPPYLEACRDAGVDLCLLGLPAGTIGEVRAVAESYRPLLEEFGVDP